MTGSITSRKKKLNPLQRAVINRRAGESILKVVLIAVKLFSECRRSDPKRFDRCVKDALNGARTFFKTGVPELNVGPLDPFFAEEVVQQRGGPSLWYRLTLRNVYERGWSLSEVTDFESDLANGKIRYRQWFPEKYLQGEWEIVSNILKPPFSNSGAFDLSLCEYP